MADVDGADDFDFLIGDWSVVHRRLKRRLVGETEWVEFSGPATARKILDGLGNIDEYRIDLPAGAYVGSSLRLFNPATQNGRSTGWQPRPHGSTNGRQIQGRPGLFFGDTASKVNRFGFICRMAQQCAMGNVLGYLKKSRDELDHDVHSPRISAANALKPIRIAPMGSLAISSLPFR